jgi:hypothetical protein
LGFSYFLGTVSMGNVPMHLHPQNIIIMKSGNFCLLFVGLHYFFLRNTFTNLKSLFKNFLKPHSKELFSIWNLIVLGILCYNIGYIRVFAKNEKNSIEIPRSYKNLSFSIKLVWPLIVTLVMDYGIFGAMYWIKCKYSKINSLSMMLSLLKFSVISFVVYGLYTG